MRRIRAALLAAIIGFGCLALPRSFAGARPLGPILVQARQVRPRATAGRPAGLIRVHTELETGWIATFDGALSAALRARGARFAVLDPEPGGKEYFLVDPSSAGEGPALDVFGRTIPVDEHTALFGRTTGAKLGRSFRRASRSKLCRSIPASASRTRPRPPGPRAGSWAELLRPPSYDSRVASSIAQVSTAALAANVLALQNFQTRYASYPGCEQAGDYLYNYFAALGLAVEFDPFTFSSNRSSRNIVATLPGKASPEYVVILCAHYDSTTGSTTGPTTAPGATTTPAERPGSWRSPGSWPADPSISP